MIRSDFEDERQCEKRHDSDSEDLGDEFGLNKVIKMRKKLEWPCERKKQEWPFTPFIPPTQEEKSKFIEKLTMLPQGQDFTSLVPAQWDELQKRAFLFKNPWILINQKP